MNNLFETFGLTENEIKVYKALLALRVGTKTPIVRESGVLSSKVYEVLDRLIQKGLVSSFIQNSIKHYVPVQPTNILALFDEKIKVINDQKKEFERTYNQLFKNHINYLTEVQLFRGWSGMKSIFNFIINDLKKEDTYYILGATPGEDIEKAVEFFSKADKQLYQKKIKIRAIGNIGTKKESELYIKEFGKNFDIKYFNTIAPFEIGITTSAVVFFLLEKNPIGILINNRKIRDSFLSYFNTLWKLAKK